MKRNAGKVTLVLAFVGDNTKNKLSEMLLIEGKSWFELWVSTVN